jgi:hypothetical protein
MSKHTSGPGHSISAHFLALVQGKGCSSTKRAWTLASSGQGKNGRRSGVRLNGQSFLDGSLGRGSFIALPLPFESFHLRFCAALKEQDWLQ